MRTRPEPGSVVVGVDGSPQSDEAARWAAVYAQLRHLPLMLVNGARTPATTAELLNRDDVHKALRIASRQATDRALAIVRNLTPDLPVTVSNPAVDARQALLDCAETAGMVVVGTRGRGPVRSLLLGSVSVAVVTHAACPVTVVRGIGAAAGRRGKIVIGVDDLGSSSLALDFGFELASEAAHDVVVLHTWDASEGELSYHDRTARHEWHERALAEAVAGYAEKYPDVAVERRIHEGRALPWLLEAASLAEHLVVGSRGLRGIASWTSSVSRSIVEHANCAVTVVPSARPPVGIQGEVA